MEKKPYAPMELELVMLEASDIVTASGGDGILSNDTKSNYDDGGWT